MAKRAVIGIAIVGAVAYCLVLHALLVSGTWPTVALALILAPWLVVIAPWLARAWRSGSSTRRAAVGLFTIGAAIVVGWTAMRVGPWLASRVHAVLYVENLVFFAWLTWLFASGVGGGREPLVTRMARRTRRGDMPPSVVRYTYFLTVGWAVFFVVAMSVSTLLFFTQPGAVWSLYINVLLWPLVAGAMVFEYVLRLTLLRNVKHVPFSAAIHAFRERSDDA